MPVIEALAEEYAGRVRFVRVDVEPDDGVLEAFDAKGVPSYLVFRDGVAIEQLAPKLVDWRTEQRLRKRIESTLALAPNDGPGG